MPFSHVSESAWGLIVSLDTAELLIAELWRFH